MVRKDIKEFLSNIPGHVKVVAATKYVDEKEMKILYAHGIKDFGENRVDSFLKKRESLSKLDITWHFIGHLQTNKAKKVINKIDFLHSLDSLELAKLIEKYREKPLKVFIEVSINNEETKNGVNPNDIYDFINKIKEYNKIEIIGLMMMAIADSTHESLLDQFGQLKTLRDEIEEKLQIKIPYLSMGMSDDYNEAIASGASHIRLGRILYE